MADKIAYRFTPIPGTRGLYRWEMQAGSYYVEPTRAAGHNVQQGDVIHIEHDALAPGDTVLHSADWPTERKSRFRLWHNGQPVEPQVVRHVSYDQQGKVRLNTVRQTLTVAPDTREAGPTQTQGTVEEARPAGVGL